MKTETIADILQLHDLIGNPGDNYYMQAVKLKQVCRLAKRWNHLQEFATGQPLSIRQITEEASIERRLPLLCHTYPIKFDGLYARLVWAKNREFYFPDLARP